MPFCTHFINDSSCSPSAFPSVSQALVQWYTLSHCPPWQGSTSASSSLPFRTPQSSGFGECSPQLGTLRQRPNYRPHRFWEQQQSSKSTKLQHGGDQYGPVREFTRNESTRCSFAPRMKSCESVMRVSITLRSHPGLSATPHAMFRLWGWRDGEPRTPQLNFWLACLTIHSPILC